MAHVNVGGWVYEDGCWKRGSYVVKRRGSGLAAWMHDGGRSVNIGTSGSTNVPAFLNKIDGFIHLKENVYA